MANPNQPALPMIEDSIITSNKNCLTTLFNTGIFPHVLDINLPGPFLMSFDKPNAPEMIEVMNENKNKLLERSIPSTPFAYRTTKSKVKCICGMDSTKGSGKYTLKVLAEHLTST